MFKDLFSKILFFKNRISNGGINGNGTGTGTGNHSFKPGPPTSLNIYRARYVCLCACVRPCMSVCSTSIEPT
jgi:hypothetical protein